MGIFTAHALHRCAQQGRIKELHTHVDPTACPMRRLPPALGTLAQAAQQQRAVRIVGSLSAHANLAICFLTTRPMAIACFLQAAQRDADLQAAAAASVEACHVEEIFADSKFLVSER